VKTLLFINFSTLKPYFSITAALKKENCKVSTLFISNMFGWMENKSGLIAVRPAKLGKKDQALVIEAAKTTNDNLELKSCESN